MKTIKAVVFDYGNVIARFDVHQYLRSILPFSSLSGDELAQQMKQSSDVIISYETGLITSAEFFREVSDRCRLTITEEEFVSAYINIFEPVEGTHDLVRSLHGRYKLGLLSNTSEWHYQEEIRRSPVFPLFEAVTVSHEVRARKPSQAIYRDVIAKLGVPAKQCVYIDDIAEFAIAASSVGMKGIHYTSHEKLIAELEQAGVRTRHP